MKPSRSAIATACTRVWASSLLIALRMWVFTVSLDSTSRSATSSPVSPWASRSMISRSRLESEGIRCVVLRDSSAGRRRGSTYVPPLGHRLQRAGELARRAVLERVAARAGVQPADEQLDVARAGVEHDAPLGVRVEQLAREVDPGLLAEPNVDQRNIGVEPLDQLAALAGGARRAHDFAAFAAQQQFETLSQGLVIFDEDEAQTARRSSAKSCRLTG